MTLCTWGDTGTHVAGENCTPSYMYDVPYTICNETSTINPVAVTEDANAEPWSSDGTSGGGGGSIATNPLFTGECNPDDQPVGEVDNNGCSTNESLIERNNLIQTLINLLNNQQANWIANTASLFFVQELNDVLEHVDYRMEAKTEAVITSMQKELKKIGRSRQERFQIDHPLHILIHMFLTMGRKCTYCKMVLFYINLQKNVISIELM